MRPRWVFRLSVTEVAIPPVTRYVSGINVDNVLTEVLGKTPSQSNLKVNNEKVST